MDQMVNTPMKRWLRRRNGATSNQSTAPGSAREILWVLPCQSAASADWTRVFPVVRNNAYARGISFVHDACITEPRVIIGWKQGADRRFILSTLRHCTPLGYGFYWVVLRLDELIRLDRENVEAICQVLEEYFED